jgi:hypothetical protein
VGYRITVGRQENENEEDLHAASSNPILASPYEAQTRDHAHLPSTAWETATPK